ncbi:MAG: hypothetical protein ACXU8U_10520 [Asticcacaulis sp.]
MADAFEDFLSEKCFVLFTIKLATPVEFYFGQSSSVEKVRFLVEKFNASDE